MQNYSQQRTDLLPMGRPVSPADPVPSVPALSVSLPLFLSHNRRDDGSDASSVSSQSLSKLKVPTSYTNSAIDAVSATEANLVQVFASMSVS